MDVLTNVMWLNARDAWLRVDRPSGTVRLANPAVGRLCGLESAQAVGRPFWELLESASVARLREWLGEWQRGGDPGERIGVCLRGENGESIPVKLRAFSFLEADGKQSDWVVIEDRREAQTLTARLDDVAARLDETERIAKVSWWEWDIRRDELLTSESLPTLFGLSSEQGPPSFESFLDVVHPDDRDLVRQRHQSARRGERYVVDFRVIWPDGSVRHLHTQGRLERDDADEPLRLFGTCQDVTERLQVLRDLRESEQKYRELVETSREFIWAVDGEGRWSFLNPAVKEIYGYEPDEMLGQSFRLIVDPESLAADWQTFQKVLAGEPLFDYETVHVRKDGQRVSLSFNAIAKHDATGRVIGATGTGMNITEHKHQEQLLRERESWFRAIFQNDPQCLMILSLDGKLLDLNPTGARIAQVGSVGDVLGRPATDCLAPESHYSFQKAVTAAAHGAARPWQALVSGKKGTRCWLEGQMVPLRDASGQVIRLLGAAQDVTARKKADALRDGEQQVLEEIASGHGLSPALHALIKMVESQLPGVLAFVCLLEDDSSWLRVAACSDVPDEVTRRLKTIRIREGAPSFADSVATGQRRIVEDTTTDPSWEPLRSLADQFQLRSCWSEPIRGFSQNVLGVLAVFSLWPKSPTAEDLKLLETGAYLAGIAIHRTRSEQRLRNSEMRFRTMFQDSPDAIFVESLNGVVLDANPAACDLHGLPRDELIGKQVIELVPAHWRDEVRRTFPKLVRGELRELESFSWHVERGEVPISLHVSQIEYQLQPALLLHVRDITERRRAEAKAREMDSQLAHAGRLAVMGELVAGISHEINQPLFAISNFANACRTVLKGEATPPIDKLLEWTQKIGDQATRAGEIIRRMRDFLRKSPQQRVAAEVIETIREATELIDVETRSQQVNLRCELPDNPLWITMDRVQIQQVLVNVLRNAIRAVSGNGLADRFVTIVTTLADQMLTVSIRDNGHGFQGHDPEMIFHPFYTSKPDGLGLGLTISRTIIEAHGGRLWGTANLDRGATFHFTLPVLSVTTPLSDDYSVSHQE